MEEETKERLQNCHRQPHRLWWHLNCKEVILFSFSSLFLLLVMCERQGLKDVSISKKSINTCRNFAGPIQRWINYPLCISNPPDNLPKLHLIKCRGSNLEKPGKWCLMLQYASNTCSANVEQCLLMEHHPLKHTDYISYLVCIQHPPQDITTPSAPFIGIAHFYCQCNKLCWGVHEERVRRQGAQSNAC